MSDRHGDAEGPGTEVHGNGDKDEGGMQRFVVRSAVVLAGPR